ncbi:MAG: SNF2-related protein [Akkermansia sp.]|nr:SNF2-related protein [Akkermansia sp.]
MELVTNYQAKYFAHLLTREGGQGVERLTQSLLNASVDLNPHQVEAALFALRSPISKGVLLADEVGLGKTIEAGLVLCQLWAEKQRNLLIICPASLRKQWQCELESKFNLPVQIVDAKSARELAKQGLANPFEGKFISISSFQYAARMSEQLRVVSWNCVVIDEAHKLRNAYREANRVGQALRWALSDRRKLLLTATPLQNSLNELYGISTLLDDTLFGDLPSFRTRYANTGGDREGLRQRLRDFCWRTLRRDVRAFVRYTDRIPITQTFESSDREHQLYEDVSAYLQDQTSYAFPPRQRTMLTLVVRKVMASSTTALIGTLQSILSRLLSLKSGLDRNNQQLLERIFEDDPDILEELAAAEEEDDVSEVVTDTDAEERPIDLSKLQEEIQLVQSFIRRGQAIGADTKTTQLLVALKVGWDKLQELGAEQKAVIFTESRRSMLFLRDFLEGNGYAGQVVCFSGGGKQDPTSEAIYQDYKADHPDDPSSKPIMMRHALIEAFRNKSKILIATEAGAEGINLQFCSMVVNYDLPWNPQRVEQRIGRCHRYGQQHDVVVINFCNTRNAADVRVFELLRDKFNLFEGIFGASNDVLGCIDQSGQSFERRIHEILRLCRTPQEIQAAFDKLQEELQEQIAAQRAATCKAIIENLDEDVREHLRIDPEYAGQYLSKGEKQFIELTEKVLANRATFYPETKTFVLSDPPLPDIRAGRYSYDRKENSGELLPYRPNSPLGEWVLDEAKKLDTPYAQVTFDISSYQGRISVVEQLKGKSGYLRLDRLVLKSIDAQEFLLFSALTDDGSVVEAETIAKLFDISATDCDFSLSIPDALSSRLAANASQYAKATANRVGEANNAHYIQATERLNRWSDDQIAAATHKVEVLKAKKLEIERGIRHAQTLDEQEPLQRELDKMRREIRKARHEIDDVEDETDAKRNQLLDSLQRKLVPEISRETLFTIHWSII